MEDVRSTHQEAGLDMGGSQLGFGGQVGVQVAKGKAG